MKSIFFQSNFTFIKFISVFNQHPSHTHLLFNTNVDQFYQIHLKNLLGRFVYKVSSANKKKERNIERCYLIYLTFDRSLLIWIKYYGNFQFGFIWCVFSSVRVYSFRVSFYERIYKTSTFFYFGYCAKYSLIFIQKKKMTTRHKGKM